MGREAPEDDEGMSGMRVAVRACAGVVPRTRHSVALLLLVAVLPLQWFSISIGWYGALRYFHIAALVFLLCFLTSRWAWWTARCTRRTWEPMAVALTALTLFACTIGLSNGVALAYTQQAAYAVVAFGVLLLVAYSTYKQSVSRALWFAAPAALCVFLVYFNDAASSSGVNAVDTLLNAISDGDPNAINFALFRSTFAGVASEADPVRTSLRHEIFGALLAASFVSLWAIKARRPRRYTRRFVWLAILVCWALTVVSMSRSALLALFLAALIIPARMVVRSTVRRRHLIGGWFLVAASVAAIVPLWNVLAARLLVSEERNTYEGRTIRLSDTYNELLPAMFTGSPDFPSPHNTVLDAWMAAGIAAAAAAALMVLLVIRLMWRLLHRYIRWGDGLAAVGFAAAASPLVRMFTAGGGMLHLSQWISLGLAFGIYAALQWRAKERRLSPVVVPGGA